MTEHIQSNAFQQTAAGDRPRAYSYLRFSTPEQERGDSFRRQVEKAKRYAHENGLHLDDTLTIPDRGVSAYRGKNAVAGALGVFLEEVRRGLVPEGSFLLIESLDRLSRDKARRSVRLLEDICEAGISVVTLSDKRVYTIAALDNDPMAFMGAFLIAVRANEESQIKSDRLKEAWAAKRRRASSAPLTARAPAWLVPVRDSVTGRTTGFQIDEERAEVVRRVFKSTLAGVGQHAIVEALNREGVPVFGRGKHWHRSYLIKLLNSPAVVGTFIPHIDTHDKTNTRRRVPQPDQAVEGYFPAIVDSETYEAVQAMRQSKGSAAGRGRHAGNEILHVLAGGLARCPVCGETMTRVNKGGKKGGKPYLVCQRAKVGAGCTYRSVPCEYVEEAILRDAEVLAASLPCGDDVVEVELENVTDAIDTAEDAQRYLLEALEAGRGTPVVISDRLRELEHTLEELNARRSDLWRRQEAITPALVEKRSEALREMLTDPRGLDRPKANALLRQLVAGVVIDYENGQLCFQWQHGGECIATFAMPSRKR